MPSNKNITGARRAFTYFVPVVLLVVILDQVTKYLVRGSLVQGEFVAVIPGIFDFTLVYNRGAAFGIMQGATTYFVIIAAVITAAVIVYLVLTKNHSVLEVTTLALIIGGAIGNCIDRVMNDGTVTDFIATAFMNFPVFNVADIAVTCGCILFILAFVFLYRVPAAEEEGAKEAGNDSVVQGEEASATDAVVMGEAQSIHLSETSPQKPSEDDA